MSKILGNKGATNSGLHDHNHRALVIQMLRTVENRLNVNSTFKEIRPLFNKPEYAAYLEDAVICALINAINAGNKFLNDEAELAAAKSAKAAAPAYKAHRAPPQPIIVAPKPAMVVKAEASIAKAHEAVAKSKALSLSFLIDGKALGDYTFGELRELGGRFTKIGNMGPTDVVVSAYLNDETLAKL